MRFYIQGPYFGDSIEHYFKQLMKYGYEFIYEWDQNVFLSVLYLDCALRLDQFGCQLYHLFILI